MAVADNVDPCRVRWAIAVVASEAWGLASCTTNRSSTWVRWSAPCGDVAGCSPSLLALEPAVTEKPFYTAAPPTPTLSPLSTVAPTGHGRPYTASDIAAAFADVPAALPDQLRTPQMTSILAEAIASAVETYDGRPYREIDVQASCAQGGGRRCDDTVSGIPAFASTHDEQDTYWFLSDDSGIREHSEALLRGFPVALSVQFDLMARSLDADGVLADITLLSAEWLQSPPADAYQLRYGLGNEEGDPTFRVRLDRSANQILSIVVERP